MSNYYNYIMSKSNEVISHKNTQRLPALMSDTALRIELARLDEFNILEKHYSNDTLIFSRIYLAKEKYDELQKSKDILEIQLKSLQKQVDENQHLRFDLQHKIDALDVQIKNLILQNKQLICENVKLNKYCDMFAREKIHQKFGEASKCIFDHMCHNLCSQKSNIFIESNISDIYQLCDILHEIHDKNWKQNKWSIIHENESLWIHVYDLVRNIMEKDYDITDMNIFFDIISLRNVRNQSSHPDDPLKFDELQHISKYAEQIWNLLYS